MDMPIPVSVKQEIIVPSVVDDTIAYVIKPLSNADQPAVMLHNRVMNRKREPYIRDMRRMMLDHDFSEHYDAAGQSRIHEIVEALLVDALGLTDDDYEFIAEVETWIIAESSAYELLAEKDEELTYEQRLANLAALLYAVEKDGVRTAFPPRALRDKIQYLTDHVSPADITEITMAGANLFRLSETLVKNSEPPSTSDSGQPPSITENGL